MYVKERTFKVGTFPATVGDGSPRIQATGMCIDEGESIKSCAEQPKTLA
jgi:hypothetical protein